MNNCFGHLGRWQQYYRLFIKNVKKFPLILLKPVPAMRLSTAKFAAWQPPECAAGKHTGITGTGLADTPRSSRADIKMRSAGRSIAAGWNH